MVNQKMLFLTVVNFLILQVSLYAGNEKVTADQLTQQNQKPVKVAAQPMVNQPKIQPVAKSLSSNEWLASETPLSVEKKSVVNASVTERKLTSLKAAETPPILIYPNNTTTNQTNALANFYPWVTNYTPLPSPPNPPHTFVATPNMLGGFQAIGYAVGKTTRPPMSIFSTGTGASINYSLRFWGRNGGLAQQTTITLGGPLTNTNTYDVIPIFSTMGTNNPLFYRNGTLTDATSFQLVPPGSGPTTVNASNTLVKRMTLNWTGTGTSKKIQSIIFELKNGQKIQAYFDTSGALISPP